MRGRGVDLRFANLTNVHLFQGNTKGTRFYQKELIYYGKKFQQW
jgi:hypothetical protein